MTRTNSFKRVDGFFGYRKFNAEISALLKFFSRGWRGLNDTQICAERICEDQRVF